MHSQVCNWIAANLRMYWDRHPIQGRTRTTLSYLLGGVVASWLVCLSLDQASRNRNRDKLWPGGPLGMYADLTLPYPPLGQEEGKSPVWLWYFQRTQKLRLLQTFLGVLQKKKLGCDERSHLSHEVCPVHSLLLLYLKSPTTNRVLTVTIHTFALGMPSNTIDLGQ